MEYTANQRQAIDVIDRNLQIIACAGSGKTRVVAARVINILKARAAVGIKPEHIVAFTFTEKAAAELKDRITRFHQVEFGHVEGLAGMYVGTIHGFCLDLLQRYLNEYLKYDVLDEVKQRLLIDRFYQQSGMASLGLKRWIDSRQYIGLLGILREADIVPGALDHHPVRRALEAYQVLLDRHRYFDYGEIVLRAVCELMEDDHLRERIARQVRYLTVDEYQDVSPIQEALIRQLHDLGANLCVVGDDDQNIYQWRGSDVRHIVRFVDRYPDVVQVPLATNFRSTPAVVKAARRVVEVNHERLSKDMQSGSTRAYERGDLLALKFDDIDEEAIWIAEKIKAMRGAPYAEEGGRVRGLSWSDCAILLRSVRNTAEPIIEALRAREIPYIVSGMNGLFDTPEIRATVALFRFMIQEVDATELAGAWRSAAVGLSDAEIARGVALLDDRRGFDPGKRFGTYNLQRLYLDFLEAVGLREDSVPGGRGEVVFYNLGKFSQVISDYEQIHFHSKPEDKYTSFVSFLTYQAPDYYPEGGQDAAYASPDAVRIMTVHAAKGMEFPIVFLPCLQKNRFPARRQANRVWKLLPQTAVRNHERYDTDDEAERRLFYVAVTRSEKYLYCSWAPQPTGNNLYSRPSAFFVEMTRREEFLTRDPARPVAKIDPAPRRGLVNVEFSFSDLKYFFECPYQFKLRLLYGFNPPIQEALGYGRSLHNALAEIHRRAIEGEAVDHETIPDLLETHLHTPFAYPDLKENLKRAADRALSLYLDEHGPHLDRIVHAEEVIQLTLPGGVVVNGRIDLIKRTDTDEVTIVDFKSQERAQQEDVTRRQLHIYALGYEQRFGQSADLIEVHNLDQGGSMREEVDNVLTGETVKLVDEASNRLRDNRLDRLGSWCETCARCDMAGICRSKPTASAPMSIGRAARPRQ